MHACFPVSFPRGMKWTPLCYRHLLINNEKYLLSRLTEEKGEGRKIKCMSCIKYLGISPQNKRLQSTLSRINDASADFCVRVLLNIWQESWDNSSFIGEHISCASFHSWKRVRFYLSGAHIYLPNNTVMKLLLERYHSCGITVGEMTQYPFQFRQVTPSA